MNAQQLIELVLRKLDRPADSATVELYRDRLMGYFNEAILDLVAEYRPWRRDTLPVAAGQADLSALPRGSLKVIAARVDGTRRLFYYGSDREKLLFPGLGEGTVEITYWYQPAMLQSLSDEPQLPEAFHVLLAEYAAARERSRFDAASQNGARLDLTLYRELKGKLRRAFPSAELSRIYNIY